MRLVSPCDFRRERGKQPHLSPQHYELNDRQHMLDQTRVLVSKRYAKAMKKQQAWGSRCADLTAPHRNDPLFIMQEYITNLVSKGREGGRENLTIDLQQVIATLLRRTYNGL